MATVDQAFDYDVFLSYSSKDKEAVRDLDKRLGADGLRVWLDEREFLPGDNIRARIISGLERSRRVVLVHSQNGACSEWVELEVEVMQHRDPVGRHRCLVPLLLTDVEIRESLRLYKH